jgi:hypothetical protein
MIDSFDPKNKDEMEPKLELLLPEAPEELYRRKHIIKNLHSILLPRLDQEINNLVSSLVLSNLWEEPSFMFARIEQPIIIYL